MSDKIYLDSNILVYLFSDDEPEKQQIARKLVHGHSCITGINNLNEMNCVLVQKKKLSVEKTRLALDYVVRDVEIAFFRLTTLRETLRIMERYNYSYFDSLVIAMALESNCKMLYTEDMHHGQILEQRLTIWNPFSLD